MKSYLVLLLAFMLVACGSQVSKNTESDYDRIREHRTIRCGYATWPKYVDRNPTGEGLTGLFVDITEEIGKRAGLTIEWTTETSIGDIAIGIKSGKFDLYCGGLWPTAERALNFSLSRPAVYSVVSAFTRPELVSADLNDSKYKMATIEGEASEKFHAMYFSKTSPFGLPKSADGPALLLAITSGKADFAASDRSVLERFDATYPGTIAISKTASNLARYGSVYAANSGEIEFINFLNTVLDEIENDGTLRRLRSKYTGSIEIFSPVLEGF